MIKSQSIAPDGAWPVQRIIITKLVIFYFLLFVYDLDKRKVEMWVDMYLARFGLWAYRQKLSANLHV